MVTETQIKTLALSLGKILAYSTGTLEPLPPAILIDKLRDCATEARHALAVMHKTAEGIEVVNHGETVTVCDVCLRAACWQGVFMCDEAKVAGTTEMTRPQLATLARESSDYWNRDPLSPSSQWD